jgi:hypothetical protein
MQGQVGEKIAPSDLSTRWGQVVSVAPRPHFTSGERTSGTHLIGDWVELRAGLGTEAKG